MSAAGERQNRIVELVSERGSMQVERLAGILDMSRVTIRKDLDKLEQEGIIERRHGAVAIRHEATYTGKMVTVIEEEQQLTSACAAMVKPGDTVFLDPGITTCEIAERIMGIPSLTVTTDGIEMGFLLHRNGVGLTIYGGTVQGETRDIFGTFSNRMTSYIHVGIIFTGVMFAGSSFNVLTPAMDKASLKCVVTKNANRSYLVVDHSKSNRQALMKINNLQDYTSVVTTEVFDEEELGRIQERDIHLIMVGDGTEQTAAWL